MTDADQVKHVYDAANRRFYDLDPGLKRGSSEHERIRKACKSGIYRCADPFCSDPSLSVMPYGFKDKAKGIRKIAYFYHSPKFSHEPPGGAGEGTLHLEAKQDLQDLASAASIRFEVELSTGDRRRRSDVTVWAVDGSRVGYEIQMAAISPLEFRRRNSDYLKAYGYREVRWVWPIVGGLVGLSPHNLDDADRRASSSETAVRYRQLVARIMARQGITHYGATDPQSGLWPSAIRIDVSWLADYGFRSPHQLWFYAEHGGHRHFVQAFSEDLLHEARTVLGDQLRFPTTAFVDFGRNVELDSDGVLRCPSLDAEIAAATAALRRLRSMEADKGQPAISTVSLEPPHLSADELSFRAANRTVLAIEVDLDGVEAELGEIIDEEEATRRDEAAMALQATQWQLQEARMEELRLTQEREQLRRQQQAEIARQARPIPFSDWLGSIRDHSTRMELQRLARRLSQIEAELKNQESVPPALTLDGWAEASGLPAERASELLRILTLNRYLAPVGNDLYSVNPRGPAG